MQAIGGIVLQEVGNPPAELEPCDNKVIASDSDMDVTSSLIHVQGRHRLITFRCRCQLRSMDKWLSLCL